MNEGRFEREYARESIRGIELYRGAVALLVWEGGSVFSAMVWNPGRGWVSIYRGTDFRTACHLLSGHVQAGDDKKLYDMACAGFGAELTEEAGFWYRWL